MVALITSGTLNSTVGGGEQLLHSLTTEGVYVLVVDMSVWASGDTVTLRMKTKIGGADTMRTVFEETFDDDDPPTAIEQSIPFATDNAASFYLEHSAGTTRAWKWKVLEL